MSQALSTIPDRPRVYIRDGDLFTTSLDIARYFKKGHRVILAAIERYIEEDGYVLSDDPCLAYFCKTSLERPMPRGGVDVVEGYEMNETALTLICWSLTGGVARAFKLKYIAEFQRMRRELSTAVVPAPATAPTIIDLDDPRQLLELSVSLLAKTQELRTRAEVAEVRLEEARPAVEFKERVEASKMTLCLTDACKLLELRPKAGIQAMADVGLIFKRTAGAPWTAYQPYLDRHWFKPAIVERDAYMGVQTLVTGKGIVAIAARIGSPLTHLEIQNRLTARSRQPDLLALA